MSQFFASGGQSIGASALASVLPMEYSGLISFRTDEFDLLAVQGTLKSLLQYHSSKATLWTAAQQAPLSMGSSWQEHWSGLPCPPPAFGLYSFICIINKGAMNSHVHPCVCVNMFFFHWDNCPGVQLLSPMSVASSRCFYTCKLHICMYFFCVCVCILKQQSFYKYPSITFVSF